MSSQSMEFCCAPLLLFIYSWWRWRAWLEFERAFLWTSWLFRSEGVMPQLFPSRRKSWAESIWGQSRTCGRERIRLVLYVLYNPEPFLKKREIGNSCVLWVLSERHKHSHIFKWRSNSRHNFFSLGHVCRMLESNELAFSPYNISIFLQLFEGFWGEIESQMTGCEGEKCIGVCNASVFPRKGICVGGESHNHSLGLRRRRRAVLCHHSGERSLSGSFRIGHVSNWRAALGFHRIRW